MGRKVEDVNSLESVSEEEAIEMILKSENAVDCKLGITIIGKFKIEKGEKITISPNVSTEVTLAYWQAIHRHPDTCQPTTEQVLNYVVINGLKTEVK